MQLSFFFVRAERVILDGNELTPLELKIFARQLREAERPRLDTLVLNHCALDDDCLAEIAKFCFRVPNLQLQGNTFSAAGLGALTRYCLKVLAHQQQQQQQQQQQTTTSKTSRQQQQQQKRKVPPSASSSSAESPPLLTSKVAPEPQWRLRTLDLRACKLDSDALATLADLAPHLTTLILSYNSFVNVDGVREFAARVADGGSLPPPERYLQTVR